MADRSRVALHHAVGDGAIVRSGLVAQSGAVVGGGAITGGDTGWTTISAARIASSEVVAGAALEMAGGSRAPRRVNYMITSPTRPSGGVHAATAKAPGAHAAAVETTPTNMHAPAATMEASATTMEASATTVEAASATMEATASATMEATAAATAGAGRLRQIREQKSCSCARKDHSEQRKPFAASYSQHVFLHGGWMVGSAGGFHRNISTLRNAPAPP